MIHKNIKLLTWFNFFSDFKLYAPVAIIYFTRVSGSFALGMSVFSIAMVSSALFELPTGIFSDYIGRRKTIILGALAAVFCTIFYAIGGYYWILVIGAIIEGLSGSFYSGNNDAFLHDTLVEEKNEHQYDEFLGRVSKMFQVALGISAILGSVLASWSFSLIMWLSVIPQIICVYLSFKMKDTKIKSSKTGNIYNHIKNASIQFVKNYKLRLLSISSILTYGIGEACYQFQSAFYNTLWPLWSIGFAKSLSNIGAAISFHYGGRFIKKFGLIQAMLASNIYNRTINIIATFFPTIISPLLMASSSLFFGVSTVAKSTLFQKEFSNEQRATMGSLNSLAGSLFFGIISLSIGLVADKISPAIALFSANIILLISLWLYWKIYKIKAI